MMELPSLPMKPSDVAEFEFSDLVAILWGGKRILIGSCAAAVILAMAYLVSTPPKYEANALLQIEGSKGNMLALPSSMSDLLSTSDTSALAEMEIIKSRQVLGQAVANLNLDWRAEPVLAPVIGYALTRFDLPLPDDGYMAPYARKGEGIELSYLEVPPNWLGEVMIIEKLDDQRFSLTLPDDAILQGEIGALAADKARGVAIRAARLDGPAGRQFRVTQLSEQSAIATLGQALRVSERGRQTGIVDVRLRGDDRAAIVDQLNAVTRAYVEQNVSKSAAEAQKSLTFVESQLPIAEARVTQASQQLNDYRSANQSIDLEFETQSLLSEATAVEGRLREVALKEEEVKERYTPNHPVYRQLLEERAVLSARLAELQAGISTLPETQRDVVNLTRNLDVAQASFIELLNRAQELRVLSASQIGSVRIVDDAATEAAPVAPRSTRTLALALIMGAMVGIVAVIARHWSRRGARSVAEIERMGIPVFATINAYTGRVKAAKGSLPFIARDDPDDIVVEAFRSLRTSLHFGMLDAKSKTIVVVSTAPGAGKSFVSSNLAFVSSQAGQRVCLVDADMRRGTQRKVFNQPRKRTGLADYLADKATLDEVLCESGSPNLSLILTGAFPPNPSELLMRHRLEELIDALDQRFDLVIFDAPPLLAVTDAAIIGRHVGMVIAVARHLVTPLDELDTMRKTLESSGVSLKGAVFNAFDPRRAKTTGRRYQYGYTNRYAYKPGNRD